MIRIVRCIAAVLCAALCASTALPAAGAAAVDTIRDTWQMDEGGFPVPSEVFLAHLSWFAPDGAALYTADGYPVAADAAVATGQRLRIAVGPDSAAAEELDVVVLGDVLGTGSASLSQVNRIAQAIRGTNPLEGIWLAAADLDGSGTLGLSDLVQAAREYMAVSSVQEERLQRELVPAYVSGVEEEFTLPLYFEDSSRDIPYVSAQTMGVLLLTVQGFAAETEPWVEPFVDGSSIIFQRPDGPSAVIDCEEDTIYFDNFDAFFASPHASTVLDTLSELWIDDDGTEIGIMRAPGSISRDGQPIDIHLRDYAIDAVADQRGGYLPLATFSDIFWSTSNISFVYNGEAVFVVFSGDLADLEDRYYSVPPAERSAQLCAFTYNELCLAMDLMYGLREEHNIEDFDTLFRQTGLRDQLLGPDGEQADRAMVSLLEAYLADGHSRFNAPSSYAGKNADLTTGLSSPVRDQHKEIRALFEIARAEAFPDGVPMYEEVGDTAYLTIDELTINGKDALELPASAEEISDVGGLITYAHSQITRRESPIRNVVVDISLSPGGVDDASIFVLGWLLGTAWIDQDSALTGAQTSTAYRCDVNLDGVFDDRDSVQDLNRFCLISPASFSNANLLPAMLKGTEVAVVGQQTGGGACLVLPLAAADGSLLQISSPVRTCVQHNGSYYEADRGIEPDYPITRVWNFYDRPALAEYLSSLAALPQ